MRVLWLCSTPALGAELVGGRTAEGGGWVGALEEAVKRRDDIDLSIAFPWRESEVRAVEDGRHEYLPYPAYPRGGRLKRLLVDASCRLEPESEVRHLERVVELSRPDLIHVWGTEAFFGLVADRCEAPVLIEIQGPRTPYTHAYCAGLSKLDLLRYGSLKHLLIGRSLLHQFYRYRRSAAREREILEQASFVSGRTHWDRLICAALAPKAQYFHCDRVLRPQFYDGRWPGRSNGKTLRIVSTLRGNAYKGIETVAHCASLLSGLLAGGFQWTLIGVRPHEEIHRVVERKLGVDFGNLGIELKGRQPAEKVAQRLLESDLYVLPSRIENSPNGLCEAMALGLPCIATNAGGTPSLVQQGEDALLVPPGDPWALAGAIRTLAEDSDLAQRLGAAARTRARTRHDPTTVAGTLTLIYERILDSEAGPAATDVR